MGDSRRSSIAGTLEGFARNPLIGRRDRRVIEGE